MTDLPAAVRLELAALLPELVTPVTERSFDGGATRKTLWCGHDGTLAESVPMRCPDRATVCVSSQAGCGMACRSAPPGRAVVAVVRRIASPSRPGSASPRAA